MSVLVLGYIRPELDYVSKGTSPFNLAVAICMLTWAEALISDINTDVKVALHSLARPEWAKYSTHPFLVGRRGSSAGFSA
jgi:riboflavin kinase